MNSANSTGENNGGMQKHHYKKEMKKKKRLKILGKLHQGEKGLICKATEQATEAKLIGIIFKQNSR